MLGILHGVEVWQCPAARKREGDLVLHGRATVGNILEAVELRHAQTARRPTRVLLTTKQAIELKLDAKELLR